MKVLVLGDIHGRDCWKKIIEKESPDKVIFLGDYVSTHEDITAETQINNLRDILDYKISQADNVILLRGNHDMQHLGYHWAECSGYDSRVANEMMNIKDEFLNLSQWIYQMDNIIFSHAGISTEWLEQVIKVKIEEINNIEPNWYFGFWPSKMSDYYGISPTQPPTWIRPQTLVEYMPKDYIQVVGHTHHACVFNFGQWAKGYYENTNCPDLWCCDALPNQYLIINDNEFIVKNYDE